MENGESYLEEAIPLKSGLTSSASSPTKERGYLQRSFLHSVKMNDVCGVRALAAEDRLEHPQSCDELGRTALIVAIDKGNYDMIKCLLELQHDVGDALFHAVSVQNAHAVRVLCKNLPESVKLDVINGYPCCRHYVAVTTPLLLAGKNNNFEIMKILLEHGAKLPHLNDLIARAKNDRYLKFLAMVNWYETASSEAYILLTSDYPLDTIFKLGESLGEAADNLNAPLFIPECERMQGKLADLSTKLLSLARDNGEIGELLRGGEKASPYPKVPRRIHQALDIDSFKKFVCHPSSQAYMNAQWEIPHHLFLAKLQRRMHSYIFNALIVLLYPLLSVAYILLPWKRMQFMKTPEIRFLMHAGSRFALLPILIVSTRSWLVEFVVSTDFSKVNVTSAELVDLYIAARTRPFTLLTIVILLWIAGMTVRVIKQLWSQGASSYFKNGWNMMDFLQLVLYWIFVITGVMAFFQAIKLADEEGILEREAEIRKNIYGGGNIDFSANTSDDRTGTPLQTTQPPHDYVANQTLHTWLDFQAQLVSEAAFALANVLSFLQILHHLIVFSLLGPLLVSFIGMIYDVLKFFMIFGFLLVSFSIGLTQLYHKFEALEVNSCRLEGEPCLETPFLNFGQSMGSLFWSLFNMVDLENLEIDKDLGFTETIGSIMYASFMLIGSIILLNALIAMMSNTYTRVEENSEVEWKVARTRIMVEYITESSSIPPPFNLVPTVKSVLWLFRYLRHKCRPSLTRDSQQRFPEDEEGNQESSYKPRFLQSTLLSG